MSNWKKYSKWALLNSISLLAVLGLWESGLTQSNSAPLETLTKSCNSAIFDLKENIKKYKDAYVSDVMALNIETIYEITEKTKFTTDRPLQLTIFLNSSKSKSWGDAIIQSSALNILSSPKILYHYSQIIVKNCEDIVSVRFTISDYQFRTFGFINGSVQAFSCYSNSVDTKQKWGYTIFGQECNLN